MLNDSSSAAKSQQSPAPKPASRVSWGPFSAIVVTLLDYVVSNIGAGLLMALLIVGLALPWVGVSNEQFSGLLGGTLQQFVFVLAAEAAALGFLWWFMRRRSISLADIGFGRRPRWSDLGWAAFTFFCYFGVFIFVSNLVQIIGVDAGQKQDLGIDTYGLPAVGLVIMFVTLVVLPPVTEEIIFRGFLFSGLRKAWGIVSTILFTSVFFGFLHLFGGFSGEGLLWIAGIDTFVLSVFLCYLRYKTDSLWGPILVHAMKNSLAFVALFILHQA